MDDISYDVQGYLTVSADSLRVPLGGELTLHLDRDSGLFTGDLTLRESPVSPVLFGVELFSAVVRIVAASPVIGRIDYEGRVSALAHVDAILAGMRAAGRDVLGDGSCRTATHAVVPLHSGPGFDLASGGRLSGRYARPAFTGCGWLTPLVNVLVAGPENAAVIDLTPRPG